jgi:hypothetical protein
MPHLIEDCETNSICFFRGCPCLADHTYVCLKNGFSLMIIRWPNPLNDAHRVPVGPMFLTKMINNVKEILGQFSCENLFLGQSKGVHARK